MNIGKAIKLLREQKQMTKTDFANKSGITKTSISTIEKGETAIRHETVVKAAKGLKVPPALIYLWALDGKDFKGNTRISHLDFESSITKTRSLLLDTCWSKKV